MSKKIINKVANSGLITIDLADYSPKSEIIEFDLQKLLLDGDILKEKDFRAALLDFNFSIYTNKIVALFCSSNAIVPMWAYMLITVQLNNITSEIYYGDKKVVFQKLLLQNIRLSNTSIFKNKKVIIKGCGNIPLNESLYIAITKNLQAQVSSLMFGEACSSVPVYKRK